VIAATLIAFAASLAGLALGVQKQFFPAASRPELLVDLWLPNGASLKATEAQAAKVEALLAEPEMKRSIKYFASYLGNGSPRFYLPLDQQLFNDNFAQFVITTHDIAAREDLKRRLEQRFADAGGEWSGLRTRVLRLENGPPVGFPVLFRVSGEDLGELRRLAAEVASVMRTNPTSRKSTSTGTRWARQSVSTSTRTAHARSASARRNSRLSSIRCSMASPSPRCARVTS
jgi:multidrug efflux pump subunit AcrB